MQTSLSVDHLRQLSKGNEGEYFFDFSLIDGKFYAPLFRSLQKNSMNLIKKLGFNCDGLTNFSEKRDNAPIIDEIKTSIASTKSHYARNMVELLNYIFPRSNILTDITISNIIVNEEFDKFVASFGKSHSLRSINLSHVPLENEGLSKILKFLNPSMISTITINHCGITDDIVPIIIQFISKRINPSQGITVFQLNEISQQKQKEINDALINCNSLTNDDSQIKEDFSNTELSAIENVSCDYTNEISSLREKNRILKEQIKAIREMANSIKINNSLFVIGNGAEQLVQHLTEIEQKLRRIDQGDFY